MNFLKPSYPAGSRNVRLNAVLVSACVLGGISPAVAQDSGGDAQSKPPAPQLNAPDENLDYSGWVNLSAGANLIQGNQAQAEQRSQLPNGAFGGVDAFHYEKFVGQSGIFKIDGRGIFNNHDYRIRLELSDPEKGYLRAGYREYRTWYDGSGGFLPANGAWYDLYDDELAIDRGEAWFEGGLTLPGKPQISFKYQHLFRDGQKNSTSWGRTGLTPGLGPRGIIPTLLDINERRDIFSGDVKHTLGKTDLGLGVRYQIYHQDNARQIDQHPQEASHREVTQNDGVDSDLFNAHASTRTQLGEKYLLTSGYSFTTMDTDLSGNRVNSVPYFGDQGFGNLQGGSRQNDYTMNLSLMATPWEHVTLVPSVRAERSDTDGASQYDETLVGYAYPSLVVTTNGVQALSTLGSVTVSEGLEARYTGFRNWVLYARGNWSEESGDLKQRALDVLTQATSVQRATDDSRFRQKYALGANWYPLTRVSLASQYYHEIRNNSYDHTVDSTPNTAPNFAGFVYPAFLVDNDFDIDDVNFRVTYRPFGSLSLITRYDFQLWKINAAGAGLNELQTAETTSHIIGESATWVPVPRWYLQGNLNYALNRTDSPVNDLSGNAADLVLPARNDYWSVSLNTGYALNDKTDVDAGYFYYRADNYVDNSNKSVPYAADAEEHGVTVGLTRLINPRTRFNLKYGYFRNRDATSGGHNDYDAHLVYASVQYRF